MTDTRYAFEEKGRFARGWHIVALSQELAPGAVKALHYFNEDLVLFRGNNGQAVILDAYCPHLGAHLAGTGSRVVGDTIRCPFHGWQFDCSGSCTAIPYANKIPERAKNALKSWPTVEKNGFIALWYDSEGGAPNWELPTIPEWNQAGWGDWRFNRTVIRSHGREIIENIVDAGHFPSVHGGHPLQFDNRFTAYSVSQESRIQTDLSLDMIQPRGIDFDINAARRERGAAEADSWGVATYHGPSVMYYYTTSKSPELSYASWWLNYHTPINNEEVELTSGVIVASLTDEPLPQEFVDQYPLSAIAAFGSDVEVWETKKYRSDPILCDGDGPINKLRKWYDRFYRPRAEEAWDEPERVISSVRE
ncbi:Rieske 2Fe-2S domain-containing protein [Litorivivens sp.]|uniref:Rieske 2Fe-2S domain-containing protein n=2 Tax=Litorivivens sp. TaxID=2020868 RepID=UPI003569C698